MCGTFMTAIAANKRKRLHGFDFIWNKYDSSCIANMIFMVQ